MINSDISHPAGTHSRCSHSSKAWEIVQRAIIWGFIGSIFGGLFVGFRELYATLGLGSFSLIPATACAGAVGAAFYGSMRVAVLGSIAGVASCIAYLSVSSPPALEEMLIFSGICGTVIGLVYGKINRSVSGALMKSLTGLIAGAISGSLAWYGQRSGLELNDLTLTALLVPATGFLYVFGVFRFVDHMECKLPLPLVGCIVAGVVSAVVATGVWAIQTTLTHQVGVGQLIFGDSVIDQALAAVSGGILGGMLSGATLAAAGLKWLDMD